MAQAKTKTTSIDSVMLNKAFAEGMFEVSMGFPFSDKVQGGYDWYYERGRLFAVATGERAVRVIRQGGRKFVDPTQVRKFIELYNAKVIL